MENVDCFMFCKVIKLERYELVQNYRANKLLVVKECFVYLLINYLSV